MKNSFWQDPFQLSGQGWGEGLTRENEVKSLAVHHLVNICVCLGTHFNEAFEQEMERLSGTMVDFWQS